VIGDISLVRALGIRGLPVAVVTEDSTAKCTRSRYCRTVVTTPSWMTEPDRAIAALIAWGRAQPAPPVLFYQGDHDLIAVSRARERLAPHFRFVLPDKELVEDLVDKRRFAELAGRRGLPVPDTMTIPEGSTVADVLRRWDRFPCVFKPTLRRNWYELIGSHQKALRLETRAELELLLRRVEADIARFVLQQCIEGGEENVLSYHAYVRPGGEVVAEFTGRKLRTSPRRYGLSTYVEITDDDEVRRLGRETMARLGFSGVLKIDCKRDAGNGDSTCWRSTRASTSGTIPQRWLVSASPKPCTGIAWRPIAWNRCGRPGRACAGWCRCLTPGPRRSIAPPDSSRALGGCSSS
jgi:predicted ATP-grasp superfamily ATP-dependent carboligase